MFINITKSETGTNTGSCGQLVNYLEKENRFDLNNKERWFNNNSRDILPHQVRTSIDANIAKLCRSDSKFYLLNISPSQKELEYLSKEFGESNIPSVLKEYAEKVMDEYAKNFHRTGISDSRDLLWFGKVEKFRYHGFRDKDVKEGRKKTGERKEGLQYHVQIIVSRKDITNKLKLSPQNNSRGKNIEHSKKLGQFDRVAFKESGERIFDEHFGFDRPFAKTLRYANTMKKGTVLDKLKVKGLEKLFDSYPGLLPLSGKLIQEIDRSSQSGERMEQQLKAFEDVVSEIVWELKHGSIPSQGHSGSGIRELIQEYYKRKRRDRKIIRFR